MLTCKVQTLVQKVRAERSTKWRINRSSTLYKRDDSDKIDGFGDSITTSGSGSYRMLSTSRCQPYTQLTATPFRSAGRSDLEQDLITFVVVC